jgi:glycosyltransferase involved in cell wall biosynthesis
MDRIGAKHIHAAFANGPATVAHFVSMLTGGTFSFAAHAKDLYLSSPDILTVKASAAEFVLVCSHGAANELQRIIDSHQSPDSKGRCPKIIYAPHGVNTDRFQPAGIALSDEASRPRPLRILAVGRLVPKKGYSTLLEALRLLRDQGEAFECRIVGGGDLRDCLVAQMAALELSSNVSFLGSLTQDQIIEEYHQADIFVQASVITPNGDRDGIPNSVLEAMACGLAVVASSVAGIPEVIDHKITGLLVPPANPAALARAIGELAADPEVRAKLSSAARRYVTAHLAKQTCIVPIANMLCPNHYGYISPPDPARLATSGSHA